MMWDWSPLSLRMKRDTVFGSLELLASGVRQFPVPEGTVIMNVDLTAVHSHGRLLLHPLILEIVVVVSALSMRDLEMKILLRLDVGRFGFLSRSLIRSFTSLATIAEFVTVFESPFPATFMRTSSQLFPDSQIRFVSCAVIARKLLSFSTFISILVSSIRSLAIFLVHSGLCSFIGEAPMTAPNL